MANAQSELDKLERLRGLLIDDFIRLAENNELTPTDRRSIQGMLKDSNMLLDPLALPQTLKDKLTSTFKPGDDLEDDVRI